MDRLRHVATSENVTAVAVAAGFIAWCGISPTGWVITGAAVSTIWATICLAITDLGGQAAKMAEHLAERSAALDAEHAAEREEIRARHDAAIAELDAARDNLKARTDQLIAEAQRAAPFKFRSFDVIRHRCEATGPAIAHRTDTKGTPTFAFEPRQATTTFFDRDDNQQGATYTLPVSEPWNLLPLHSKDRDTDTVMVLADWIDNHTEIDVVIDVTDIAGFEHVYDVTATDGQRTVTWTRHRTQTTTDA